MYKKIYLPVNKSCSRRERLFCVGHFIVFCFLSYKNISSFFLSHLLPPNTREVPSLRGDRGMLAYTGQNHFSFLLTLTPSGGFAATFPDKRGRLTVCILSFYGNNQVLLFKNMNSFFLNVSFPRTRREVPSLRGDRGKLAYTGQNHFPFLLTLAPFVS